MSLACERRGGRRLMRRVEESGEPVGDLALGMPSISRTNRVINRNFGLAEPESHPSAQVPSPRLTYPLHDRDVLVTACGRICMHRKRINISTVLAGQRLGIKEVDDGIWFVSFMHYDLGFIDLEQKTLQPLDNPFGTGLSPMS